MKYIFNVMQKIATISTVYSQKSIYSIVCIVFRLLRCFLLDLIMCVPIASNFPEYFISAWKSRQHLACNSKPNIFTRHMIRVFPVCHRLLADKSRLLLRNKKLHIDIHPKCFREKSFPVAFTDRLIWSKLLLFEMWWNINFQ